MIKSSLTTVFLKGMYVIRHSGLKQQKCNTCGKVFSDVSNFKRYVKIHSGLKQQKCNTCGKVFSDVSNYKRYVIRHSGLKQHKCYTCGKVFSDVSSLKTHVKCILERIHMSVVHVVKPSLESVA